MLQVMQFYLTGGRRRVFTFLLFTLLLMMGLALTALAQNTTVKVITNDELGKPVGGVTVSLKLNNSAVTATTNVGVDTSNGDFTYGTSVAGRPSTAWIIVD